MASEDGDGAGAGEELFCIGYGSPGTTLFKKHHISYKTLNFKKLQY